MMSQSGDDIKHAPQTGSADRIESKRRSHQGFDGRDEDLDEEELALQEAELELADREAQLQIDIEMRKREQQNLQATRDIEDRRVRLAKLAEGRARLTAKLEAASQLSSSPTANNVNEPTAAQRNLDFGTPFTRNMPDMYGAAIGDRPVKKQQRRSTISCLDDDGDDIEAALGIKVPMPDKFDGTGLSSSSSEPSESVAVKLAHALDSIEDYIEYLCDFKGITLSARQFVKIACRFLTGIAAGVYKHLQLIAKQEADRRGDAVPLLVLWPQVRSALEQRFGKPRAGHQLIRQMMKLRQKVGESVEDYTVRFDSLHMELTRQNLASRDLTVALYMEGLLSQVKEKVDEVVNSVDYLEREDIGVHEARKAITALQLIATAREAHLASVSRQQQVNNSRPPQQAPVNQQSSHSNQRGHSSGKKNGDNRVQVPDALYSERIAAGLCGKCNSAAHVSRDCSNSRNLLPVPKRNGARANKIEATESVDEDGDAGAPKKL